jgi:hypothetical protein
VTGLSRRLNRIERTLVPLKGLRIVLRFEGPGSEHFPQATEPEIRDAHQILNIVSVPSPDRRVGWAGQ